MTRHRQKIILKIIPKIIPKIIAGKSAATWSA